MQHNVSWPPLPIKFPSRIPKFEAKDGENPSVHNTTFHLWFSLNSLNDEPIRLRLFQRTLNRVAAKWYIEIPSVAYDSFMDLETVFLNHFQLPFWYDADTDLFSTFRWNKDTHNSNHIQEWRRQKRLIKSTIPPKF